MALFANDVEAPRSRAPTLVSDLGSDTTSTDLETALAATYASLGGVPVVSDQRSDTNVQHQSRTEPRGGMPVQRATENNS